MNNEFRFKITFQTIKDYWRTTLIITFLFMILTALYAGMFPSTEEALLEMKDSGLLEDFNFIPNAGEMYTYIGFLTIELYSIFWLLILAIILGFIAASSIAKEIEGKTIDLLMSNPVSRKQIVFEKFIGLIPMFLIVNFATMFSVMGITIAINENLNFGNLFMVHVVSIPYFLVIFSVGILISVLIDEKMKASIIMISILVGMFVINSLSLNTPDSEFMGFFSINHYFDSFNILKFGEVDIAGVFVFIVITIASLVISMICFEHKDIRV